MHLCDWPEIILTQEFMALLSQVANKRFTKESLADEAVTYALEALSKDDWVKLKDFNGDSKPTTYALSIATRLFEDFSRKRFGRPRPPSWLKELGQGWIKLWRMLCLERQWPETIKQKLSDDYALDELVIRMSEIKRRLPNCGAPGFAECSISELGLDDGPDTEECLITDYHTLDEAVNSSIQNKANELMSAILHSSSLQNNDCPSNSLSELELTPDDLGFSEEDCLLITLCYEDGLSSRKISALIDQSPSYIQRRLRTLRGILAERLTSLGIDSSIFSEEVKSV